MGTWFEDFPFGDTEPLPVLQSQWVTEGYFEAMGIQILEGRAIDRFDHLTQTGATLVSRNLARMLWGTASPLGKRFRPSPRGEWYTVVGVAEDVRQVGADQDAPEMVYYPMIGVGSDTARFAYMSQSMGYAVRTGGSPEALIPAVREAVWSIDPNLPVSDIQPLEDIVSRSMASTSFTMLMLVIAAAMSLLLATVGIYGVISYVVSQRTSEIGIRVALGATRLDVSRMVMSRAVLLTGIGVGVGLLAAASLSRLMESLLFGVAPTDPLTYLLAALTLTVVSLLATYLPARRAAIVDPVEALRAE
jgi:predicted permease